MILLARFIWKKFNLNQRFFLDWCCFCSSSFSIITSCNVFVWLVVPLNLLLSDQPLIGWYKAKTRKLSKPTVREAAAHQSLCRLIKELKCGWFCLQPNSKQYVFFKKKIADFLQNELLFLQLSAQEGGAVPTVLSFDYRALTFSQQYLKKNENLVFFTTNCSSWHPHDIAMSNLGESGTIHYETVFSTPSTGLPTLNTKVKKKFCKQKNSILIYFF